MRDYSSIVILVSLMLIILFLIDIRAALVHRGKVACYYCGNYFKRSKVEVFGSYTYCSQHGKKRQVSYAKSAVHL